jgi:hypothetical protein
VLLKLFLKTVIYLTIPYGFVMGLMEFIKKIATYGLMIALLGGLIKGSILGLLFGVTVTSILLPFHYICFKKVLQSSMPLKSYVAKQSYQFEFNEALSKVFKEGEKTLKKIPNIDIVENSFKVGRIVAVTPKSWKSFREKIILEFSAKNATKTIVNITSQPLGRFTMLDYGKNYENIKYIYNKLSKII